MSFNTTSYLAGVGTVVAALTIGFSGGFFLAPPADYVEQNRLQRVASGAPVSNQGSQEALTPKPEVTPARSIELIAAKVPAPSQQPPRAETVPVMAKAVEPVRGAFDETAKPDINTEKVRAAEAKAERKRAIEQRRAERRKQREMEATIAVKRVLRDRDPQQVAERSEPPRFGFFGED
jgi:hypothetical protein